MKAVCLAIVLAATGLSFCGGCATPAYSGHERWEMIQRNWGIEERQMNDDIDTALLLRPASGMTIWNVH